MLGRQGQKLEDKINEIKKTGCGRMARIFKLKQKIVQNKKAGQEPTAIRDPEIKELVVSPKGIRNTTLKYCVNNLSNNKMAKNVESILKFKEILHNMKMRVDTRDDFVVEYEEFNEVVKVF